MPKPNANETPEENYRCRSEHQEEKTSDEDVECKCILTKVVALRPPRIRRDSE
jgi:hypothetical protein